MLLDHSGALDSTDHSLQVETVSYIASHDILFF